MNDTKCIGLDVHKTSVSAAVLDQDGKLVMQSVFATHAAAILSFIHGLRGTLRVTFEEGTHSTWLYDLLHSQVAEVLVCNPRKNALLKSGNKSDQIDARKLADLLRGARHDTGDGPAEGLIPQPGDCHRGEKTLYAKTAGTMVGSAHASGPALPRRAHV